MHRPAGWGARGAARQQAGVPLEPPGRPPEALLYKSLGRHPRQCRWGFLGSGSGAVPRRSTRWLPGTQAAPASLCSASVPPAPPTATPCLPGASQPVRWGEMLSALHPSPSGGQRRACLQALCAPRTVLESVVRPSSCFWIVAPLSGCGV